MPRLGAGLTVAVQSVLLSSWRRRTSPAAWPAAPPFCSLLSWTLKISGAWLTELAVYMFLINTAFALTGMVLFGDRLEEFRNFGYAFVTMFQMALGIALCPRRSKGQCGARVPVHTHCYTRGAVCACVAAACVPVCLRTSVRTCLCAGALVHLCLCACVLVRRCGGASERCACPVCVVLCAVVLCAFVHWGLWCALRHPVPSTTECGSLERRSTSGVHCARSAHHLPPQNRPFTMPPPPRAPFGVGGGFPCAYVCGPVGLLMWLCVCVPVHLCDGVQVAMCACAFAACAHCVLDLPLCNHGDGGCCRQSAWYCMGIGGPADTRRTPPLWGRHTRRRSAVHPCLIQHPPTRALKRSCSALEATDMRNGACQNGAPAPWRNAVSHWVTRNVIPGNMDYARLSTANRFYAPIFWMAYAILEWLLLMNLVIGIITEGFATAKQKQVCIDLNRLSACYAGGGGDEVRRFSRQFIAIFRNSSQFSRNFPYMYRNLSQLLLACPSCLPVDALCCHRLWQE